jgi:GNAT superfamily N-acetyltransferase
LEFRKAGFEDIPSLVEMRILYSLETYGELSEAFEKRMQDELPDYFKRHLGNDLTAYIAVENGDVVSTALLLVIEKPINPVLMDGRNGIVLNVFTKPEHRRKKLATALMTSLLQDSDRLGLDYVELKATESGYPLYTKLGFSEKNSENVYMTYVFVR